MVDVLNKMKKKLLTPNPTERDVAILRDGLKSPFWTTLKGILSDEMEEIKANIMAKYESKLSDKDVDELIRLHGLYKSLTELPEQCIASLERQDVNDGSDEQYPNDPYPLSELREKIIKK